MISSSISGNTLNSFTCITISPIGLQHPGLAIATARAGGIGILDCEFCPEPAQAVESLHQLLDLAGEAAEIGLRLRADEIGLYLSLLQVLQERRHWLILSGWQEELALESLLKLPISQARVLLLEVTDPSQVTKLSVTNLEIHGWVGRGQESGGWVGEDPAFILLQKLVAAQSLPVYVQGGIGFILRPPVGRVGQLGWCWTINSG